jgi:predicted nucleic acid-binding protein
MVVVDASCAVKWFVPEPDSAIARELLVRDLMLVAPDILGLETMGALTRKHRRGEVAEGVPVWALEKLVALRIDPVPHAPLLREATALSLRLRHAVYDCLYLLVAQRRRLPLATFDQRLAAIANSLAIPLWSPEAP